MIYTTPETDLQASKIYQYCAHVPELAKFHVRIVRVPIGYSVYHLKDKEDDLVVNCVDFKDYQRRIDLYLEKYHEGT